MAHRERRMTPLYLLEEERMKLDKLAKKKGLSRQRLLEDFILPNITNAKVNNTSSKKTKNQEPLRYKTEMKVYFGPSHQSVLSGYSVDLGTGGLYLKTSYPFKVNDELKLIFSLPKQDKSISCMARVAWLNTNEAPIKPDLPEGVGLQFINLSLDDVKIIAEFVEKSVIEGIW